MNEENSTVENTTAVKSTETTEPKTKSEYEWSEEDVADWEARR